jgi:hypothetical protein
MKEPPDTHWIGNWVGPRAGLDNEEKRKFLTPLELELLPVGCPARSQSLYQLCYPGSHISFVYKLINIIKMYEYA